MAYQESSRPPEYLARKGEGAMSAEDFRTVVGHALAESVQFVDTELSIDRAMATEYYLGKPFGNEEEGRSQVVLTEVADAVDGMVPSLIRVAFPPGEHAVEFTPNRADAVEQAEQQTDYVRYVVEQDNAGFLRAMDVLKDGLIRKIGIFKWWWDTSVETKAYKQEGITQQELEGLASDDDVELRKVVKLKPTKEMLAAQEQAMQQYQQQPQGPPPELPQLYDVDLTRTIKGGRPCIDSVPPEEFIFNRQARRLDKALLVAHRTEKTRGQLIAMGVSKKDLDEHAGTGDSNVQLRGNAEEIARRDVAGIAQRSGFGYSSDPEMGDANDKILYTEAWMTIDYDGDGIAELRRVCTVGSTFYPVKNDPTDEIPFAIFTPVPEPHTLLGRSIYDKTADVQRINSSILRAALDSGSASAFPRTVYLEGQAAVADIMNTAIGAPIRERVQGAVRYLEVPFTGKELLPVLEFMQEVIERRTGRNKGAAGLDADALQSTGKEAVGAVLSGGQEQLEVIARVFAEQALKPLYKGIVRMLIQHQPRTRVVKLRGRWVEVNPKSWDADMDVTVNVCLGSTFTDKKIATLMSVAADQKEIITNMGLSNPLVTLPMLRNTRAKILALQGIKDVDNYYAPLPQDWQPPQQPPQPSPEQLAMEAEKHMNELKVVKELAIKSDELKLKEAQQTWEQQFEIQKLATDAFLRKYATDAQFHSSMTQAQMDAQIETEAREAELTIQGHDMLHGQMLDRAQHEHDKQMDVRAADTADTQAQQAPE